jgi:hypothetical protein
MGGMEGGRLKNLPMREKSNMDRNEAKEKFGQRVQRCYGCFVAFHVKDLWLGEGGTYYCRNCKDESMFHFEEYSKHFDFTKLVSLSAGKEAGEE